MVEGHPESLAALDEAANAFREGHFISVILLALAAVEHELVEALVDGSLATYSVKAKDATDRARQHQVLDVALLERVTQLRLVRNPFVHLKPPDHAHGYAHRYIARRVHPKKLLEEDAQEVFQVMYSCSARCSNRCLSSDIWSGIKHPRVKCQRGNCALKSGQFSRAFRKALRVVLDLRRVLGLVRSRLRELKVCPCVGVQ